MPLGALKKFERLPAKNGFPIIISGRNLTIEMVANPRHSVPAMPYFMEGLRWIEHIFFLCFANTVLFKN